MSERGGTTPNLGIPYKGANDPAVVHEDNERAYLVIDAKVGELEAKMKAREQAHVIHTGEGEYQMYNGLGEQLVINENGDGTYRVLQP